MKSEKQQRAEMIALFRYGVIADLIHLEPGTRGLYARFKDKADGVWSIPYSRKNRIAQETIRHWLKLYRRGGFDALRPKVRKDAGQSRHLPQTVADQLIEIKDQRPTLTVKQVIAVLRDQGRIDDGLSLPVSTVHRLLSRHGLTPKQTGQSPGKDRRRFAFAKAGQLWMSDVMHGPAIVNGPRRTKRKTYLIAFIDDATRVVPYAAFCRAESIAAFLPVLKQALMRRGIPQRLYVDNGAAYRAKHLQLVCAKLGITLLHARPYDAAAKGKQERWFRTVRMQLLPMLTDNDTANLDALNRRLWAWVEGEYHHNPHRGLDGQTPLDRWAQHADEVNYVGPHLDLDDMFLFDAKRKVYKDRTVSLDGAVYEVEPQLVGKTVLLRYDPLAPAGRPLQVWSDGKRQPDATVVDAYQNCFVRRHRDDGDRICPDTEAPTPPQGLRLAGLSAPKTSNTEEVR